MTHKVKIELNENGKGKVLLDGKELHQSTFVSFNSRAGDLTEVTLKLFAKVEMDIEVEDRKLELLESKELHNGLRT